MTDFWTAEPLSCVSNIWIADGRVGEPPVADTAGTGFIKEGEGVARGDEFSAGHSLGEATNRQVEFPGKQIMHN